MKRLLILAAAASIAACHSRNEDQAGAAPDQGNADTTAVTHAIDTTRTGPPGVGGRPGNATVTTDSVIDDTSMVQQGGQQGGQQDSTTMQNGGAMTDSTGMTDSSMTTDSTAGGAGQTPTSTPQDTLGPRDPNTGTTIDSTGQAGQTGADSATGQR